MKVSNSSGTITEWSSRNMAAICGSKLGICLSDKELSCTMHGPDNPIDVLQDSHLSSTLYWVCV